MEKQLQTLQSQLTNNRSEITSLQTQLVQAQNQDLPSWVHIMLGMLALALATIAWLLQRIKQERMNAQRSWADTVLAVDDSAQATSIDTRSSTAVTPQAAAAAATPSAAEQPTPFEAAIASAASKPAPQSWSSAEAPSPTVMPEELYAEFEQLAGHKPSPEASPSIAEVLTAQALFDVQEQAEFYASIGRERPSHRRSCKRILQSTKLLHHWPISNCYSCCTGSVALKHLSKCANSSKRISTLKCQISLVSRARGMTCGAATPRFSAKLKHSGLPMKCKPCCAI